jgi:hypothetical protein
MADESSIVLDGTVHENGFNDVNVTDVTIFGSWSVGLSGSITVAITSSSWMGVGSFGWATEPSSTSSFVVGSSSIATLNTENGFSLGKLGTLPISGLASSTEMFGRADIDNNWNGLRELVELVICLTLLNGLMFSGAAGASTILSSSAEGGGARSTFRAGCGWDRFNFCCF